MRSLRALVLVSALAAVAPACTATPRPEESRTPAQMLAAVEAEVIPAEGSATGYGPAFDEEGYATLIQWNDRIRPSAHWAGDYERMNVLLPCCAADRPFADEERNCGCGHHRALYGAAKHLLDSGYSRGEAQAELDRWRAFFFPRQTLLAELEARSLDDPSYAGAIEALDQRGGC